MDQSDIFKPTWDEITTTLVYVGRTVIEKTTNFYYTSNAHTTSIDGRRPPVDERPDLLTGLMDQLKDDGTTSSSQLRAENAVVKRVSVSGDPQSPSDRFATKKMRKMLHVYLGDYVDAFAGEEYGKKHWRKIRMLPGGTRFLLIDDLDGSTNLEVQGGGYSTNMVLYGRTKQGKNVPLASVTVDARGWALVVDRRQERVLLFDPKGKRTLLSGDEYRPRDAHICLAVVARSGAKRARIASILVSNGDGLHLPEKVHGGEPVPDPAADVSTLGGAPAIMQYLIGGLGMVVLIDDQSIWDAAPLLGAPLLGLSRFYSIETEEKFSGQDVLEMFSVVARPSAAKALAKPVKAMLVVRRDVERAYPEAVAEIVRRLRDDYKNPKRLVAVPVEPVAGLRIVGGSDS